MASTSPRGTDLEKLWGACGAGNADRIRFQISSTLKSENAQDYLQDLVEESGRTGRKAGNEMMRALLASGASAEHISFRWFMLRLLPPIEVLRLLAENGLDFRHSGRLLLG